MHADLDNVAEVAQAKIANGTEVEADLLREWMTASNREIRAIAFVLLVEHPKLCLSIPEREQYDFVLATLAEAMGQDGDACAFQFWFGKFDALLYINALLLRWRSGTPDQQHALKRLVDFLGDMCLAKGSKFEQYLIDVTLEHILMDKGFRKLFEKWRHHEQLRSVFERGCQAAQEWDQHSCDYKAGGK